MKFIKSNAELEGLHSAGEGFIYNDFSRKGSSGKDYNVLHVASCGWVARSNVNVPKYFFSNIGEAIEWLRKNRGEEGKNWKRCGTCQAKTRPLSSVSREPKRLDTAKSAPICTGPFTETEAEKILLQYLREHGYKVRRQVRVASGIVDVVAEGPDGRWFIEVKGEDRGGYTSAEMNFQVGLGQLMSRMKHHGAEYGLAFPVTKDFLRVLSKYKGSLVFEKLGIHLIAVEEDGTCRMIPPDEVLKFLEEIN